MRADIGMHAPSIATQHRPSCRAAGMTRATIGAAARSGELIRARRDRYLRADAHADARREAVRVGGG